MGRRYDPPAVLHYGTAVRFRLELRQEAVARTATQTVVGVTAAMQFILPMRWQMFLTARSRSAIVLAMARPKEFDRDVALRRAIQVFWKKGFARTSAEDLVAAMGIGKQSLYDTFGDKRRLFLESLRMYNSEGVAFLVKRVAGGASRIAAIEGVLVELANEQPYKRALGCMGVNSICELGDDEDALPRNDSQRHEGSGEGWGLGGGATRRSGLRRTRLASPNLNAGPRLRPTRFGWDILERPFYKRRCDEH